MTVEEARPVRVMAERGWRGTKRAAARGGRCCIQELVACEECIGGGWQN